MEHTITSRQDDARAVASTKSLIFAAAAISFSLSVYLFFTVDRIQGIFVGLWVPSILSAGTFLMSGGRR